METFYSIRFDLYQQGESVQTIHDIVAACINGNPSKLLIDALVNEVKANSDKADKAYGGVQANALTEEIIGHDHFRDDGIIGVRSVAVGYSRHFDEAKRKAGKLIVKSLNKYSHNIAQENMPTETTMLRNWCKDTKDNAELKAAVSLLVILDWADYINTQNEAFDSKYLKRSQIIGDNAELEKLAAILITAIRSVKHLLKRIDSLNELDEGKGTYTALINQINAIIKQSNDRAKARVAAAKAAKDAAKKQ